MTSDMTIDKLQKQYDYWLIVWKTNDGEEVHQVANFQVGIHPKDYCEEIMKSEATTGKDAKVKDPYSSYKLFRLLPSE